MINIKNKYYIYILIIFIGIIILSFFGWKVAALFTAISGSAGYKAANKLIKDQYLDESKNIDEVRRNAKTRKEKYHKLLKQKKIWKSKKQKVDQEKSDLDDKFNSYLN